MEEARQARRLSGVCDFGAVLLGLYLFFLILLNVLVDGLRKFEVPVDIAAIGVVRIGKDGELLLRLPGEDPVAARWVVVAAFYLA